MIRKKETCISCKKCDKDCPMGIKVHDMEEVRDVRCTSCMACVSEGVCPRTVTLVFSSEELKEKLEKSNVEESKHNIG